MSTMPRRQYGDWQPAGQRLRLMGSLCGGLALVAGLWLLSGLLGDEAPQSAHGTPMGASVDRRDPEVILNELRTPAAEQLRDLRIRPRKDAPDYDRREFGEAWADVDNNGCDTRNDVLARDLENVRYRRGARCIVASGTLHDPYVGVTIDYQRGPDTSPLVQIDHVVALGDAWRSGAWRWTPSERQEFANDPTNLLAVQGQANQDKESSRADQWLPPRQEFWCDYVTRQIQVKYEWDLSVTPSEREAMIRALSTCPTK